jgi:hypothetical protein
MKMVGALMGDMKKGSIRWYVQKSASQMCVCGRAGVTPSLLTAVTALVPQDDSLMRSLTVEECIR